MWHLFIWNCQARPMEEVLSCQSQDNLSVQKQILKSVHFHVGAPAPSSPPYATKTQYENVLPYSIVSECAQYMYEGEHQATCVHPPAPLPRLTPQPTSREAGHISEHKRSVSVILEIRSPWSARTTHQDWRRLRSTWSRGIFYRVLKDIVIVTLLTIYQ